MKTLGHRYSFMILTLIAGLDLLAAVLTDIPDGIIGAVLATCLILMMFLETSATHKLTAQPQESLDLETPDIGRASHD